MAWVVDSVLVQDERVSERADLEQSLPVHGVARQPTELKAEHDSDMAQANIGNQLLEAFAVARSARLAKVAVDHNDTIEWPAESHHGSRSAYWRLVLSVF